MAITRTQATSIATSTGGTTVAPSWGSATTAGALLVACVVICGTGSAGTVTPPSGWATADSHYPGSNAPKAYVFYKENAASQSGAQTFTNSVTDDMWAVMIEYAGMATSSVLDVVAHNGSTGGSANADSGTTAATGQADEVAVAVLGSRNTNTYSSPTNGFSLVDQGNSGNASTPEAVDCCWLEKILSATGAQGTSTTNTDRPWVGVIATFKAAGGGTDATVAAVAAGAAAAAVSAVPALAVGATIAGSVASTVASSVLWSPRADVKIGSTSGV